MRDPFVLCDALVKVGSDLFLFAVPAMKIDLFGSCQTLSNFELQRRKSIVHLVCVAAVIRSSDFRFLKERYGPIQRRFRISLLVCRPVEDLVGDEINMTGAAGCSQEDPDTSSHLIRLFHLQALCLDHYDVSISMSRSLCLDRYDVSIVTSRSLCLDRYDISIIVSR